MSTQLHLVTVEDVGEEVAKVEVGDVGYMELGDGVGDDSGGGKFWAKVGDAGERRGGLELVSSRSHDLFELRTHRVWYVGGRYRGGNGGVGVGSRCGVVYRRSWKVGSPMQGVVVGTREQAGGVLVLGPCSQPVCTHPV